MHARLSRVWVGSTRVSAEALRASKRDAGVAGKTKPEAVVHLRLALAAPRRQPSPSDREGCGRACGPAGVRLGSLAAARACLAQPGARRPDPSCASYPRPCVLRHHGPLSTCPAVRQFGEVSGGMGGILATVLRSPFRPWPSHVVKLGSVAIEQARQKRSRALSDLAAPGMRTVCPRQQLPGNDQPWHDAPFSKPIPPSGYCPAKQTYRTVSIYLSI